MPDLADMLTVGPKEGPDRVPCMEATFRAASARILISRTALLHNVKVLRSRLAPAVRLCAMVKANAYGHDAAIVADALTNFCSDRLEAPAVDAFAVVTFEEALALGSVQVPVMILRPVENALLGANRSAIVEAIRSDWILTVSSPAAADDLARIAMSINRRANVQVMLDTGCAREGTPPAEFPAVVRAIDAHPSLRLHAICTHFVSSEEPENPFTQEQLRRFNRATGELAASHPHLLRHAANSGAIFFTPHAHLDMVRPGIALYGVDPSGRPHIDRPLRPVLRWVAPLAMIRQLQPGDCVGYNQTWRATRATRVGLVPVGYADGYCRAFSNTARMMIRDRAVPVVGRVSMDYTTIDLTDVPDAQAGDTVTVLDNDPLSPASVYALSELANTIPYEVFTRIGPRMTRVAVEPADVSAPCSLERKTA